MLKTVGPILLFNRQNKVAFVLALTFLSACAVDRPHVDLVLAREAFAAAQEVDGAKYSPANFHLAEEAYRKAIIQYKNKEYKEAIQTFRLARLYSEKAENVARIQRQKSGEEGL